MTYGQTYATRSVAWYCGAETESGSKNCGILMVAIASGCLRLWKLVFLQVLAVITCKINFAVLPFRISVVQSPQVAPVYLTTTLH